MELLPKTYSEIGTLAACNSLARYFELSMGQAERFFNGLNSGEIRQVFVPASGDGEIRFADGSTEKVFLNRTEKMAGSSEIESCWINKGSFGQQYTAEHMAYLSSVRSSSDSGGSGSNNNNNNNNNNNH